MMYIVYNKIFVPLCFFCILFKIKFPSLWFDACIKTIPRQINKTRLNIGSESSGVVSSFIPTFTISFFGSKIILLAFFTLSSSFPFSSIMIVYIISSFPSWPLSAISSWPFISSLLSTFLISYFIFLTSETSFDIYNFDHWY